MGLVDGQEVVTALEDGLVDPCQRVNKRVGHRLEKLRCVPVWGFPVGKAGNSFFNFLFGDWGVELGQKSWINMREWNFLYEFLSSVWVGGAI